MAFKLKDVVIIIGPQGALVFNPCSKNYLTEYNNSFTLMSVSNMTIKRFSETLLGSFVVNANAATTATS